MRNGDNEQADYMLQRAQVDADLALSLAHERKTSAEAQQVINKVRAIGGGPASPATQPLSPEEPSNKLPTESPLR
jgi:hypothetical protein